MAETLSLKNLDTLKYRATVEAAVKTAFEPLVKSGDLVIDTAGTAKGPRYILTFETGYDWNDLSRLGCYHKPLFYGVTGSVYPEAIERRNYCKDVTRCDTCTRLFNNAADELGKKTGQVAVHEIGHLFGLTESASFTGANSEGHSGDPGNAMFAITAHKDYVPYELDARLTTEYTIVKDDTLWTIARRIGFWPAATTGLQHLRNLKGKDGKSNKDKLQSKDPNKIWPGEKIWVPDIPARTAFYRDNELKDKSFTTQQIDAMRAFIKAGKTIFDP